MNPIYDDVRRWPECFRPPADVDVEDYQKRIDAITGLSDSGQSLIKLVWSWNSREWIDGVWRAKYRFLTVEIDNKEVDICPPRWVFEERYEPGQYWDSWQATRYHREDVTEVIKDGVVSFEGGRLIDRKGEPPRDGWYNYLVGCQPVEHAFGCCEKMWEQGRKACWGYYRPPAQPDLDHIGRMVARKNADNFKQSPHEPLSVESLEDAQRLAFQKSEKLEEKNRQETVERFNHYDKLYGHLLRDGDRAKHLRHGKFSIPTIPITGLKETPGGLIVPEN